MAEKLLIQAVREAMLEEMRRDERIFVMGEDVAARGGVFLATEGFLDEFGEDRVIDTPLAEASIVGVAVGAALNGMRPIAEIQFSDFIWPIVNQLTGEAARIYYGTNGQVSCPMVVRAPYGGGVPRRPLPLPEPGGILLPHARAQGDLPCNTLRRQGPPQGSHPRQQPLPLPRAQADLPPGPG